MEDQELGFKFIPFSAHRPSWAVFAKPIPSLWVDSMPWLTGNTAMLSNSQGERTKRYFMRKELQRTKSAYEKLQAMSATEKWKYVTGTFEGKERIDFEGEDDVSAQDMYAIGSVIKEPLKDVDLLFSLSSQPPNSALSQWAEEREHNFALSRRAEEGEHNFALPQWAEEREHNFALPQRVEGKENKNWVKGLGSVVPHVIMFGMCAATCIGVCLLNNNSGKKVDDLALQFKAVNEAWVAAGCPPPTVCVLNPSVTISSLFALFNFGNPSTTVSTPVGLFNRGNPSITVSHLLGLFNINIGKSGNGVEESGRGSK